MKNKDRQVVEAAVKKLTQQLETERQAHEETKEKYNVVECASRNCKTVFIPIFGDDWWKQQYCSKECCYWASLAT